MTSARLSGSAYSVYCRFVRTLKKAPWTNCLAVAALMFFSEAPAYAYIDPTVPGLVMQILAPIIIAVSVMWRRIKDTISRLFKFSFRRRNMDDEQK